MHDRESFPEVLFPDTPEDVPTAKYEEQRTSAEKIEQQAVDRGEITLRKEIQIPSAALPSIRDKNWKQ